MPEYVRVKDKSTKHEYSIVASTFDPKAHDLIEDERKPAAYPDGTAVPPKYFVDTKNLSSSTGGGSPAVASSGQKATPDKEAD